MNAVTGSQISFSIGKIRDDPLSPVSRHKQFPVPALSSNNQACRSASHCSDTEAQRETSHHYQFSLGKMPVDGGVAWNTRSVSFKSAQTQRLSATREWIIILEWEEKSLCLTVIVFSPIVLPRLINGRFVWPTTAFIFSFLSWSLTRALPGFQNRSLAAVNRARWNYYIIAFSQLFDNCDNCTLKIPVTWCCKGTKWETHVCNFCNIWNITFLGMFIIVTPWKKTCILFILN